MAAEANFVRVDVHRLGPPPEGSSAATELPIATAAMERWQRRARGNDGPMAASQEQQQQQQQPEEEDGADQQPPLPPRRQLLCTVRALLKKVRQRVLVGDVVSLAAVDWAAGRAVVDAVLPRATELADPAVANADHVVLVFGLAAPPFEPQQVSRFLVATEAAGLPLTLALNKADLVDEAEARARLEQCAAWGYRAVALSCATGAGVEELRGALAGRTAVVAGPSGAGKSSLINALRLGRHREDDDEEEEEEEAAAGGRPWDGVRWTVDNERPAGGSSSYDEEDEAEEQEGGHEAEERRRSGSRSSSGAGGGGDADGGDPGFLAVGDVSKIGRGRHTTRVVRLIPLPGGGLVADTPGFGLPTLDGVASADLAGLFPEFAAAREAAANAHGGGGGGCRFDDCMHVEEPGCAVVAANLERHAHYVKLLAEVRAREDYDVRVLQLPKRRREGALKAKAARGGATRYEARLESKKHRVESRRGAKQAMWRRVAEADADVGGGGADGGAL